MTYRKFKADYLFTGREMADRESVLITSEDGTVQDILPFSEAGEDIRHLKGLLSPGFINCHCHLELSHLKGVLPEKTGLVDFLLAVMRQRNSTPEWIQAAIADAEASMLDNGIVAVGDICNTTHSLTQKTGGRLYYHNFIETMGFVEQSAPDRFENSRKIFDAFAAGIPISPNSLVPHAPYSVSSRLFGMIANFPGNRLLTIHNQESGAENEFYRSGQGDFLRLYQAMGLDTSFFHGTGKRSLESYLPHFFSPQYQAGRLQSLILVHNVATSEEDLQFALNGRANLYFCLCPNANLYIGGELPDIALLIRMNCALVIGTDSLASNHQLSILEELKTLQRVLPLLPTPTLLKWATANGAEALQANDVLGSFDPGKKPGIVLIEGLDEDKFTAGSTARRVL
jgi:cytosine/adenosine deaminase-related metal-dependent hydrolase